MGHRTTKSKTKAKSNKTNDYTDFFYYAFRNILLVGLPLLVVSAFVLSLPHSTATGSGSTSSSDHVYFSLDTSCTMGSELINPHTVNINGGQYKTNVGTTKLNTYCNDGNGYSIYAIGSSNNTDGNNYLINSENNNYNISTGIYDSGTATVNTPSSWSMKLTSGTGTGNTLTPPTIVNGYDDYSEIPNVYTQVAKRTSETEMNTNTDVTGSYLTTTYAIYTNSYQPAGSYGGNVKYVMIHPHSNMQTASSLELAFFLAGKEKIQLDENHSYYAMQDMTSDICASVSGDGETTATQLVDIRDNKLYWITKLKDGHCWMTQNLDFDIKANTTLNSNTTDLNVIYDSSTGKYAEYSDGYTESNGIIYYAPTSTATTIDFDGTTVPGWQNSNTAPYSANKTDSTETGHASLGNYYNWTAAIASNNSSSLTQDTLSDISKNPKNSICPKGWRLPTISNQSETTIGSTNEFARLNYLYNKNSSSTNIGLVEEPVWFTLSGKINGNTIDSSGNYWSNTYSGGSAYLLYLDTDKSVSVSANFGKGLGRSVRCVAN